MKRICIYVALSLLISTSQAQTFQRTENGIKTTVADPNVNVEIQWFTPGSLRVLKTPQGQNVEKFVRHCPTGQNGSPRNLIR